MGGPIERRRWDDPEVDSLIRRGIPVILTGGCPLASNLVGRWTFSYLKKHFGESSLTLVQRAEELLERFIVPYAQAVLQLG